MITFLLPFFLTLFQAVAHAADSDLTLLPPRLNTVAATPFHRFVEYRVCSPEHCWSDSFLQWFDGTGDRSVIETAKIPELGYGTAVSSARWVLSGEKYRLEVEVGPSHGDDEPYTLVIEPGERGKYVASRR